MAKQREGRAMAKWSRVAILVASLALGLTYVLPIWSIQLEAPQYPEGLGMVIRINAIEGQKEHDLTNINNLNHYIGMKRIVPESIPELRIMPVVVAVLMVAGALVALLGRRRLLYGWTMGFLVVSLVGVADFWKWEYDYGHNLDEETAIIKIPGMSYQPPLIGSRDILNFTAHSWPGAGGMIAILAAVTAVFVSAAEWRRRESDGSEGRAKESAALGPPADGAGAERAAHEAARDRPESTTGATQDGTATPGDRTRSRGSGSSLHAVGGIVLAAAVLSACAEPGPRPLMPGVDGCTDCLMIVDGGGHGAEVVTRTGKVYTFDSAECMVNHLLTTDVEEDLHSAWVTDFADPASLVRAEEAHYLVSSVLTSPMGLGITAFARLEDRDGAVNAFGGRPAAWDDIRAFVASAWPEGRPSMKHGGHTATLAPGGDTRAVDGPPRGPGPAAADAPAPGLGG